MTRLATREHASARAREHASTQVARASRAWRIACTPGNEVPDELADDTVYVEIREDMEEEAASFGPVRQVAIPRPGDPLPPPKPSLYAEDEPQAPPPEGALPAGLGLVFLAFATQQGATAAQRALDGRMFGGRIVRARFFSESAFFMGNLDAPRGRNAIGSM